MNKLSFLMVVGCCAVATVQCADDVAAAAAVNAALFQSHFAQQQAALVLNGAAFWQPPQQPADPLDGYLDEFLGNEPQSDTLGPFGSLPSSDDES